MPTLTYRPSGCTTIHTDLEDAIASLLSQGFSGLTVEPSCYLVQQLDLRRLWLTYVDTGETVHFDGFSDEALAYILTQINISVHGLCVALSPLRHDAACYSARDHTGDHVFL